MGSNVYVPDFVCMLTCALVVMPGVHCGEIAVCFLGPLLGSEVARAKVYPYRALLFGARHFCVKKQDQTESRNAVVLE